MLHFRLSRSRRRWSISHDMNRAARDPAASTAVEAPPPPPPPQVPVSDVAAAAARRWSLSQAPDHPAASPTQQRHRRRRRPPSMRVPRISHHSAIIPTPQLVAPLHTHFPVRYHACDWQAVYSTMRDGVSLQTFYSRCDGPEPIVIVVRDSGRAVFGYYTSIPWKSSKQYYGNGEGFVFKLLPKLEVFKWSRANSFFQLGTSDSMAVGGGGKFALFLDSMFERGSSGPCATYNSPCLASSDQFDVVVLEAYKLVPSFKLVTGEQQQKRNSVSS